MLRFQIIKRMYCTPIGNYSLPRNKFTKKTIKTVKQLNIKIDKKNNKETRENTRRPTEQPQWRPHD